MVEDLIYLILNLFGRFMSLIQLVQEDNNLHFSYNYYRGNKRVGTYYSKCIKKEKCVGQSCTFNRIFYGFKYNPR